LKTVDAYGNERRTGGDRVHVEIRGPTTVLASVTDCGDGTYAVSYTCCASGSYQVHVSVNGAAIASSPFEMNVTAAASSAQHCLVQWMDVQSAVAGEAFSFKVEARDRFLNKRRVGGDAFRVQSYWLARPLSGGASCRKCISSACISSRSSLEVRGSSAPTPNGTAASKPGTRTRALLARDFGSVKEAVREMVDVGLGIQGSGWSVLAYSPELEQTVLMPVGNHEDKILVGARPLLILDVWEHAYYADRMNNRKAYLDALLPRIAWDVVEKRLVAAERV
jgi:hypothetical protein